MERVRPTLLASTSARDAWMNAIEPWFDRILPEVWKRPLPSVVVVPTRGQANDLKARLIARGFSYFGLHFVTPGTLTAMLARDDLTPRAETAHLRLLLATAAGEMENRPDVSEALAAKSVFRSPAPLLRALDRLENAGWKFDDISLASFAPIVRRFHELMKKCGFVLPGRTIRAHFEEAKKSPAIFSNVLVAGFDGAHWPHWFLLRAAVEAAENATIVLEEPRHPFSDIDTCWNGSWEEVCGEVKRAPETPLPPSDSLFTETEMRGGAISGRRLDFLIGRNVSEQAEAVTRQILSYLSEEKCTRLGVIFSGPGALPRLVASALARLEIPHNDGIAHQVSGIFESAEWQTWLELQRAPRLHSFLRFLNALPNPDVLTEKISRPVFEKILRESYSELLLDDLEILRAFSAGRPDEKSHVVAEALGALPFLPTQGSLNQFLERTQKAFAHLGWKQHALELAGRTHEWTNCFDLEFSRALFLRWLDETAVTVGAARSDAGNHPYARVQLLTVPNAQNQEWSHLIFAGWNEGAWPPPAAPEFARTEEIRAFNRSVQMLNKRAARQGSQGEGHTSVDEGHSLYLGPMEQRAIALRQFDTLVESATDGVTLTASLVQEDAPERLWNPSECFTQLYLTAGRGALTQSALKSLQRSTARWARPASSSVDVQQTLTAFQARRDPSTAVGEYDFALRSDGGYRPVPILSVSDIERMVSAPALVWIKRYLGVEAPDDFANPWAATSGKWVHRWLAKIGETKSGKIFAAFPGPEKIDERVCRAADQRRESLRHLCQSLDKVVPDWWTSGWLNALYLARHLGGKIATAKDWNWMATEFSVGRDSAVKIAENVELQLHGQIDLVLARNDANDFLGQNLWVVDYKTGSTRELKRNDIHDSLVKGTALQLGLYALALRELGAAEVETSIISIAVKSVAPQLSAADLVPYTDIFRDLAEMQQTGAFGMKGEVRPAFGYGAAYPLATIPIDYDILEDKWFLTHPALVLEKEEWETW